MIYLQTMYRRRFTIQFVILRNISCSLLLLFLLMGCTSSSDQNTRGEGSLLLDRAGLVEDMSESITRQLRLIRDHYGVEVVLATVEETGKNNTIKRLADRLFSQWDIGKEFDGQGLLLLVADREKEVRIEVGLALEGVFTDLFTGYIENKQLKSYFLSDQLATGLIAVLEEIEARANLLSRGDATAEIIEVRDMEYLSAGGGADVALDDYSKQTSEQRVGDSKDNYPAGETVEQAWQILLQSWRDKNRDPDIGVYTPVTRLIYRAYTNQPDRRFEEDVRTWGDKAYEIISNDTHAVIFFGNKKGWENAPFLFCRTQEGWQFDMVHQRKIVRMGRSPNWGIERGEHPYMVLLSRCPYWMGQDIPRTGRDIYDVTQDTQTARKITALENQLADDQLDFEILLELGRLYTLTSMGQQRFTLLKKAHDLQPGHPDVFKYLAIAHVDAHYQYKTALEYINSYVDLRPDDTFGHFFRGYLLLMEKRYDEAIGALENGLNLEPGNIYGLSKLARCYYNRNKGGDQQRARKLLNRLRLLDSEHLRVKWLEDFLR